MEQKGECGCLLDLAKSVIEEAMKKTILIVDDEADIRNLVKEILEDEGYATLTAANSKDAYAILESHTPDMAILDIWLQDSRHDGLQILQEIAGKESPHANMPIIMISGHGTIETAVKAIQFGAYDFIEKPFKSDRLLLMVKRGLEASNLAQENAALKEQSNAGVDIIGSSYHAKNMRERVKFLAGSNSRLCIVGPLGSGKVTIARLIHQQSERCDGPFIIHTCVSDRLENSIQESFKKAKFGTLVLQDICALDEAAQKEVLGYLQDKQYSDVRVISVSKDPSGLNEALYQRVAVDLFEIPSLSERKQDMKNIVEVLIHQISDEIGLKVSKVSSQALQAMEKYNWSGNMYELQAALVAGIIHNNGEDTLQLQSLPRFVSGLEGESNVEHLHQQEHVLNQELLALSLREAREVFEREYLTSQVERFEGNISKTAQFIGMERSALHRKIKSLQEKQDEVA